MREIIKTALLLMLLSTLLACGKKNVKSDVSEPLQPQTSGPDSGQALEDNSPLGASVITPLVTGGCLSPCELSRSALDDPASVLQQRLIYFEFDRAAVAEKFMAVLQAHGRFLAGYPDINVRLDGHADERGSREYNIALAERRAQSVRKVLLLEGVNSRQLQVLSYGEEMPQAGAHNETAWQQNRRVELVYKTP
ncbi:MAG: peptidoglycan-associated lipoprotein Pal [Gammaproteobacteria bacterium]|nr:peptidoglycan-associated lipoprotein Pal [Gammaproteobacteria bacterium]